MTELSMRDILDKLGNEANEEQDNIVALAPLPIPVQKFCSEINKNFEVTANNCDRVINLLRTAASELETYAKELRAAAPDVSQHVERWIRYEREANERAKFLNTLFK